MRARTLFLVCLLMVCGCSRPPPTQTVVMPSSARAVAPAPVKVLKPREAVAVGSSLVAKAKEALADDRPELAQQLLEVGLPKAAATDKARLHWLAARAAREQKNAASAAGHLQTVSTLPSPLARWAKLEIAEALEADDPAAAAQLASSLTDSWAGQREARMIEARALAAAGDIEGAIPRLRVLVEETPDHIGGASAAMPLAELLEKRGDPASMEEALALYRRVASRAPLSRVGQQAEQDAERVLKSLPPNRRRELVSFETELIESNTLFDAQRYERAEAKLLKLIRELPKGSALRCKAQLLRGKAVLRTRDRVRGAPIMEEVARECSDPDVKAHARYHAARAYGRLGQWSNAIAQYEALELESPEHRLADDARFRTAMIMVEQGNIDESIRLLESLPTRYPKGDMWPEALFRLFWGARMRNDHRAALGYLDELSRRGATEKDEGAMGRLPYWRGRTLHDLGREAAAITAYVETAERWPLRYYAQQALARLRELAPKRAEAIEQQMRGDSIKRVLAFDWNPAFDSDAFKRAIELLRVGEIDLATQEMRWLKMLGKESRPELTLVAAALLQAADAEPRLSRLIRRHFQRFPGLQPGGDGRVLWELAYPKAFEPLIEKNALREELPPAFVRAIAREESSFDPEAVSWARAYGLVQLILPTAKRFGKEVGLRATPHSLKKPKVNLRIGTRYMAWLWDRFEENPALVPSAYNAGPGAVTRWLREDSNRALDVFIEEIPYDETRRYTRRVLQSYGVYSWLEQERLPPLPRSLPN